MFPRITDAHICFQNFLNNMAADDVMTFVAHIMLYFQMTCVFPLITFIFRVQLLSALFGSEWPRWVQSFLWVRDLWTEYIYNNDGKVPDM